jgi:hypothetical protein
MRQECHATIRLMAALLVLALAGVAACNKIFSPSGTAPAEEPAPISSEPPAPRAHGDFTWSELRLSIGHQQHITKATIVCKDCHQGGFHNPGTAPCLGCHKKEAAQTHAGGTEKKTNCFACHTFTPHKAMPTCISCHEQKQGVLASVTEHRTTDCQSCHHVHEAPAVKPMDCASCHKERSPLHAAHEGSKGCLDCHTAHGPAVGARATCSNCHQKPEGPKPAGHDSCMTCHKPHQFFADAPRLCVGCHGAKPTLLASTVVKHARCTGCHVPHDPRASDATCQNCHTAVQVSHAGKASCTSCHAPHSGNVNAKASACTSCHQKIAASDKLAHAGGTPCVGCHKQHGFQLARVGTLLCNNCHAPETRLTSASRGHKDCAACHGAALAHKPAPAPACDTCHAPESTTVPVGHRQCTTCHEKHEGRLLATAASCASCHAKKKGGPHAAVKGGCETCHRPHGPRGPPAPPACVTCHERSTLPALHSANSHGGCAQCHTSHGPPRSDRATCTGSCHTGQRDHQKAAAVCSGCHVFGRGG